MFRSSTSSSRTFLRDLVVALLVLAACEFFFARSLAVYETRETRQPTVEEARPQIAVSGFHVLGRQDPVAFLSDLASTLKTDPVVFVGDSQGRSVPGGGSPYPRQYAERLREAGRDDPVVSLHLAGSNAHEHAALLLAMLDLGVEPAKVVWAHSIFSQRKNEIRMELTDVYQTVHDDMARLAPDASVLGSTPAGSSDADDSDRRLLASADNGWGGLIGRLAAVRFMRYPLWDKIQILRRSDLGSLLPKALVGGTARQFNPPGSMLRSSAAVVGRVVTHLQDRGVDVIGMISPVDRQADPRPFAAAAEAVSYPALREVHESSGARCLDLLDAIPHEDYSLYQDGSRDAFHFTEAGHEIVVQAVFEDAHPPR